MSVPPDTDSSLDPPPLPRGLLAVAKRTALAVAAIVLSINIWTGFPVLALWVGSRFAGDDPLSMKAIVIAIVVLAGLEAIGLGALSWLSAGYDRMTARPRGARQPAPWMRSLRDERPSARRRRRTANPVETVTVVAVALAVIAFEVWFLFLAGSSIPRG